jgi:tripartite-type tricarboxylate transporter receptor subunit TctC
MSPWRTFATLALAAAAAAPVPEAWAQKPYPNRPLRMVVPFAPGGGTDIIARHLARNMTDGLGEQVIVDNRPGGGGSVGAEIVVSAVPDGYTIIMISGSYTVNPSLYKLRFDPINSVSPISLTGTSAFIVCVHPSVAARSMKELTAYAKANPGRLNYGSTGTGSITQLATELYKLVAGVDIAHIPYKGTAPALADLVGGQIQVLFGAAPTMLPQIKAGRLRGLVVTTPQRSSAAPDLPTISEAGYPGAETVVWYGLLGPQKLPAEIVARLNAEVKRVASLPEIRERFAVEGLEPTPSTPEEFRRHLKAEVDKWARVVKAANVKPD